MTNTQWAQEALGRVAAPEPTTSELLASGTWTHEQIDEVATVNAGPTVATLDMATFCA
jgi:hypothetical protein